jgi:hypothetical protein
LTPISFIPSVSLAWWRGWRSMQSKPALSVRR